MERYKLKDIFTNYTHYITSFTTEMTANELKGLTMGLASATYGTTLTFILASIYAYYFEDLVAYVGENENDVRETLLTRLGYDLAIKLPYWYKKYVYITKLLTTEDLSLLQTSKMTSSSSDSTDTASGSLQKTATTPSGVSAGGVTDTFELSIDSDSDTATDEIETTGFADKYTNAQQKFATAGKVNSARSGEILREGSIEDLLKVLEKLPSSFADEITKDVSKHFIFDYDGDLKGEYDHEL